MRRPMTDWDDILSGRREYALFAELLAFVTSRIGDEDAAKKFILDWYPWEDPLLWMFDSLEVSAIFQDLQAAERYFWRKLEFVTVNWKSSGAVYNGPHVVCRRGMGKEWPLFDDRRQVTIRASLVQFPVDIAVERLRLLALRHQVRELRAAWIQPPGQLGRGRSSFLLDVVQLLFPPLDCILNQVAGVLSGKGTGFHLINIVWRRCGGMLRRRCMRGN